METVDNREVITIDSDDEEGPSWRGIRHEGTQSSDEIEETIISNSPNRPRSDDERIGDTEDFYQTLSEECTDECYEIDDYVYPQISFVDGSDDEDIRSPLHSLQEPLRAVKSEFLSFVEPFSNSIIPRQDVYPPEIYRGEPFNDFDNELPRVPESTIKLEALEIKREALENEWDMPRVQEEMDLDSMRSFNQEISFYRENTDLSQSFKSLNTSEPLQDLENSRIINSNRILINTNRRDPENSSYETENSSENEREGSETLSEGEGLPDTPEETQNLTRLLSILNSANFFTVNNDEPPRIDERHENVPGVSREKSSEEKNGREVDLNILEEETVENRDGIENSGENNSEKIVHEGKTCQEKDESDRMKGSEVINSEERNVVEEMSGIDGEMVENREMMSFCENNEEENVIVAVGVKDSAINSYRKGGKSCEATADAGDPFMDIGTQSQVLDYEEKLTDDEDEAESSSTDFDFSDHILEDIETDDEPEKTEISSGDSSFENATASIENLHENIPDIPGDISGDNTRVIEDDGIQSLGENNCRRDNFTENMEISTGEVTVEINGNGKNHETIDTESGNIKKTGDNSEKTVGDGQPVAESTDNDDILSLTATISDGFPDDDLDFGDTSDEDLDEAVPIAESTGINIDYWIIEGQKRRLEGSDDDVGVQPAAKVQRLEGTMENDYFSIRINHPAKETSPIITNLMSIDRSNTPCKLTPNPCEGDAPLCNREAEQMDVSIPHETSIHRADTIGLDTTVDIKESETSSGVSSGSPSTSPTIPMNTPHDEGQTGPTNCNKQLENPVQKYNLSASSSSESDESPIKPAKSSKSVEDSPKTVDHDYTKPKKKFRKSLFILKSKSPAEKSSNPVINTQNLLKGTPPSSVKPLKTRNSSNAFDHTSHKIPLSEKRRKASPTALGSSEEENNVKIEEETRKLKKKRKLYSRSDSIEDISQFRDDLDEKKPRKSLESSDKFPKLTIGFNKTKSPEKRPEIMEKSRIIPVEHCKTPKSIVPIQTIDNPLPESSPHVERSKIFPVLGSEFDFVTQGIDSSLTSIDTSTSVFNISSGTPDTPVISANGFTDSERMEESPDESPEAENSNSSKENIPEPSENTENNSPEDTSEFFEMNVPNSDNFPEESPETSEDEDHTMDHTLTQLSQWTPSIPQKLIPLNSSPKTSSKPIEKGPDPSQLTQNVSVVDQKSQETSALLGLEEDESMETVCPRPMTPEVMAPESLNDPQLTEDEEMPEDPIQQTKTTKESPPTQSPGIQQTPDQESSLQHLPELSEDEETPGKLISEPLEKIPRPPPSPIHLSDDDSDTEIVINPLQVSKPFQEDHHLIFSDEESQNLTHISQLNKSPPISSINSPSSSKPSEPRAGSSKDFFKSSRTIETHDEDSGHGSGHSSIFTHPRNENLIPRNDLIDDEASDGASNCSESIDTCSNSLDDSSDYQNLDDGRSKHSFPGKLIKPKKSKKTREPEPEPSTSSAPPLSPPDLSYLRFTNGTITKMQNEMRMKPADELRMKAPEGMSVSLYDHQEQALAWMLWREGCDLPGGILADDMGLGKTVTTISLISESLKRHPQIKNRTNQIQYNNSRDKKPLAGTLIVCPANLITQWHNEFQERSDIESVLKYHKEKQNNVIYLSNYNVVITTYDTLSRNYNNGKGVLFKVCWRRVVLDEAHVIRNPKAQKSLRIAELTTVKRWALTGTPVHNKIGDLYPVVRFLKLSPFDDKNVFSKWIDTGDEHGIKRLKGLMDCIMMRRTKDGLITAGKMPQLPLKTKRTIDIVLSFDERLVYDRVMTHSKTLFIQFLHQREEKEREKAIFGYKRTYNYQEHKLTKSQEEFLKRRGIIERHHILSLILRLRQICCHPSLIWQMLDKNDFKDAGIEEEENPGIVEIVRQSSGNLKELAPEGDEENDDDDDDEEEEIGVDERVVQDDQIMCSTNPVFSRESSKMKAVLEKVKEIIRNGEKVVIVSDWVLYLKLISKHLEKIPEAKFNFYIGSTEQHVRDKIVMCFNNQKNPNILLLSLRAGGQGLNLTAANHVILVDVHWNPQLEIQAEDRVYRIGQEKETFIHKFICKDTIEERIVALQERKLKLAQDVLSGTNKGQATGLGVDELCSLFGM